MKADMKCFTQIYNLVSISIPIMVIVVLVYNVNEVEICQDRSAFGGVMGGNSKGAFSGAVELKGLKSLNIWPWLKKLRKPKYHYL